ncbi:MAG: hypothetical protein AAF108_05210 [Planctomycetota bacterium]
MVIALTVLVVVVGCLVIGLPFTWLYWKQADRWAESERVRTELQRRAAESGADGPSGGIAGSADDPAADTGGRGG